MPKVTGGSVMSSSSASPSDGMSRRDLLKKGAVVGVTAAWAVPVVQAVSMTPAHADSPSAAGTGGTNTNRGVGGETATRTVPNESLATTGQTIPTGAVVATGVAAVVAGAGAVVAAHMMGKDDQKDA